MASFDSRSARRLAKSVQDFERRPRNRLDPQPRGPRGGGGQGLRIGKVTTAITKAVGATYGAGEVTVQKDNGTALVDSTVTGLAVKNDHDKGFDLNALVTIAPMMGSQWVVDVNSCSYLTS